MIEQREYGEFRIKGHPSGKDYTNGRPYYFRKPEEYIFDVRGGKYVIPIDSVVTITRSGELSPRLGSLWVVMGYEFRTRKNRLYGGFKYEPVTQISLLEIESLEHRGCAKIFSWQVKVVGHATYEL